MTTMQPRFYIETCEHCNTHQWCTRHKEEKYKTLATNLKAAIESVCPGTPVDINTVHIGLLGESQVDIGGGGSLITYTPTPHMGELSWRISQSPNPANNDGMFTNY